MRISGPLYEGDGLIHLWVGSKRVAGKPAKAVNAEMRQQDPLEAELPATRDDLAVIEHRARRLRAATIAKLVRSAFDGIGRWAQRIRRRDAEAYLAQASDHAELERRVRQLERREALPG